MDLIQFILLLAMVHLQLLRPELLIIFLLLEAEAEALGMQEAEELVVFLTVQQL
jgi:hypothetical protein